MNTYKILTIEENNKAVKIEATFDDGTKIVKRMMAPLDSEEALKGAIEEWMTQYDIDRLKDVVPAEVKSLVGKLQKIEESSVEPIKE